MWFCRLAWAGGLTDDEAVGPVISEIIDAQTGERFALTDGARRFRLVTTARCGGCKAEKRRLVQSYGAVMVDMEAASVARLAQMRGIPMLCLKVISDSVDAVLPDINLFVNEKGHVADGRFPRLRCAAATVLGIVDGDGSGGVLPRQSNWRR